MEEKMLTEGKTLDGVKSRPIGKKPIVPPPGVNKKESKKVYLVQFWDDGGGMGVDRVTHKVVDSEQKAKNIVKEFPYMFYDEYGVE